MLLFHEIPGIQVGHAQNLAAATGCTVVLTTDGAVCGIDQRGGAPGTRETDLLRPMRLVEKVHAVMLSGGSAFGLAAADGVVRWLEEQGIGFDTRAARVPIVPAAVLYDLDVGQPEVRPDAAMGYLACQAAVYGSNHQESGTVGAGTGARIGTIFGSKAWMKGGLGSAVIEVGPDLYVGAIIAVNCFGDVIDPATGQILAGVRKLPEGGFANTMQVLRNMAGDFIDPGNTVIGIVATNATLSKEAANKIARMAQNGLARAIKPAHTMYDGDTLFALSTGKGKPANVNLIGAYAAEAVSQAIINAIQQAVSLDGIPALRDV